MKSGTQRVSCAVPLTAAVVQQVVALFTFSLCRGVRRMQTAVRSIILSGYLYFPHSTNCEVPHKLTRDDSSHSLVFPPSLPTRTRTLNPHGIKSISFC